MYALIVIFIAGLLALLAEVFKFKKLLYYISIASTLSGLLLNWYEWGHPFTWAYSDNMLVFDHIALAFSSVLLITAFLWFLMARSYFDKDTNLIEHTALILFSLIGAMILVSFNNLVTLFLGIEILSIPLYVLAASNKRNILSNEAGFKYLIMGSFASAFLLFGIALLYGFSGSFILMNIQSALNVAGVPYFVYVGVVMILVALAFKVSIVPFHFWTPDVYEGSPVVVTAFMSTVVKTSVFVAIIKMFMQYLYPAFNHYVSFIAAFVILSLIVSNFSALKQKNIKRLLAFSSISHAAIMLMLVIADVRNYMTVNALLYYTFAYSVASILAFAVIQFVANNESEDISVIKGLVYKHPTLAVSLIVALLSMGGIPVTAGFFAKYYVFNALLMSSFKWIILFAILASIISIVYYLKLILVMFENDKKQMGDVHIKVNSREVILLIISLALLILAGVYPDFVAGLL